MADFESETPNPYHVGVFGDCNLPADTLIRSDDRKVCLHVSPFNLIVDCKKLISSKPMNRFKVDVIQLILIRLSYSEPKEIVWYIYINVSKCDAIEYNERQSRRVIRMCEK